MVAFDTVQEVGNEKKCQTATSIKMSNNNISEKISMKCAHEDYVNNDSEACILGRSRRANQELYCSPDEMARKLDSVDSGKVHC